MVTNLIAEHGLDIFVLQELEYIYEHWDQAPDTTGCVLVSSGARNGVGFIVSKRFYKFCVYHHLVREFGILLCEVDGVRILVLNVHLPDDGTCTSRGFSLPQVLNSIDEALSKVWLEGGWHHIVMAGDFNTVHPGDMQCTSDTVSDATVARHTSRAADIFMLCCKWHIEWCASSSCDYRFSAHGELLPTSHLHHTHIHKVGHNARVLDYMCSGGKAGLHPGVLQYDVLPELAVSSDHLPLVGSYG